MFENHSPWIRQLNRTRPVATAEKIDSADIAIVGGGIAGVTTAYFLLKNTDKKVVLLEADKIAHGATGHNAGQITGYFERSLKSIADEFGVNLAIDAQSSINGAWILLEQIMEDAKLQTPMSTFLKSVGLSSVEQIMRLLADNDIKVQGGLPVWPLLIKDGVELPPEAEHYAGLWKRSSEENIYSLLETKDSRYLAVGQERAGCMNSALFSEELVGYLLAHYGDRFVLSERTPVIEVVLSSTNAVLKIPQGDVTVERVILCTNGFKNLQLSNEGGADIDMKFHHAIRGMVGYMAAYIDAGTHQPTAITYFDDPFSKMATDDQYFYLTRRPYEKLDDRALCLISVGGPGAWLDESQSYSPKDVYPEDAQKKLDTFIHKSYSDAPEHIEYEFKWHGLMGFTRTNLRLVGIEPCNPVLMYNLGCNGVGILPSIFGADRIARIVTGETLSPSVFDPADQRCINPTSTISGDKSAIA